MHEDLKIQQKKHVVCLPMSKSRRSKASNCKLLVLVVGFICLAFWERSSLVFEAVGKVSVRSTLPDEISLSPRPGLEGWTVYDTAQTKPLFHDREYSCRWSTYKSKLSGKETEICLHPAPDVTSALISHHQSWEDCVGVSRQYESLEGSNNNLIPVHLEIGAGLGACVVDLLLSNEDVHILAFEPFPQNLFALTSTLQRNPDFRKRVTLFPVALGHAQVPGKIVLEKRGDAGTGGVYLNIVEHGSMGREAASNPHETVYIEKLDDLIVLQPPSGSSSSNGTMIRMAKIETQGYECHVLKGMAKTAKRVARILVQANTLHLGRYRGCSKEALLDSLETAGMKPYKYSLSGKLERLTEKPFNQVVVAVRENGKT